jgi:hypothetical protein
MGLSFKMFSQGDAEFYLMSFTKVVAEADESTLWERSEVE